MGGIPRNEVEQKHGVLEQLDHIGGCETFIRNARGSLVVARFNRAQHPPRGDYPLFRSCPIPHEEFCFEFAVDDALDDGCIIVKGHWNGAGEGAGRVGDRFRRLALEPSGQGGDGRAVVAFVQGRVNERPELWVHISWRYQLVGHICFRDGRVGDQLGISGENIRCPYGILFGDRGMGGRCLQLQRPIEEKKVTVPLLIVVSYFGCQLRVVLHHLQLVGKGAWLEWREVRGSILLVGEVPDGQGSGVCEGVHGG